jgi:hypothetical protein
MTDHESVVAGAPFGGDYEPRSPAERSGEHRLMLAILDDAIGVLVKGLSGGVDQREARAARAWLESRDDSLFTFECICAALGLDAVSIRRGVWALRPRPLGASSRLTWRHPSRPPVKPGQAARRGARDRPAGTRGGRRLGGVRFTARGLTSHGLPLGHELRAELRVRSSPGLRRSFGVLTLATEKWRSE